MQHNSIKEKLLFVFKTLLEQFVFLVFPIFIILFYDLFLYNGTIFIGYFELIKTLSIIITRELKVVLPYLFTVGILLTIVKSWSKRLYWILSTTLILLLLFIYLSTIQYYHTANIRLDHVILFFTFDELKHIASSETGNLLAQYLWFYLIPIFCFVVVVIFRNKIIDSFFHSKIVRLIALFLIIGIGSTYFYYKNDLNEKEEVLVSSKPYFLFESIYTHFKKKNDLANVDDDNRLIAIKSFRNFMGWESSQHQFNYPFVKEFSLQKGDLNPYFNAFDGKPNLVMVFCEGVSSSFSGPAARYGSLTPHMDSIYARSLYWPNAISNTDRTHGVFSNTLASLPQGFERGILNVRTPFPNHLSIPKILVENGYESTFTYGGWGYFDNYEPFLRMNYVQNIHDHHYLTEEGIIEDYNDEESFSWGIADKPMFNIYFDLKQQNNRQPFFDILLTLSLHSPFKIPNQDHYLAVSKKQFDKVNGDQKLYEDYKKLLSTITYQDQAIGEFMKEYEKRKDYKNTIFLFVGDHNVNVLPLQSHLETHHVPLAIFSPKLKESKQFKDIVSQSDVPQSILSLIGPYLDKEKFPKYSNWLGEGLTTKNNTSSVKPILLGSFSGDIVGIINKDTILLDDDLYKIKTHLEITKIEDRERKDYYAKELQNYRILNSYVIKKGKLLTASDTLLYPNNKAYFYFPED